MLCYVDTSIALTVDPLFYAFHLLDMVNKSVDLQYVFKSVTLNGRSLVLTAVFGVVIIWIYAIVGFHWKRVFVLQDDEGNLLCTTLLNCLVNAVSSGLRSGDIGAIMEPRVTWEAEYPYIVLYQFTYYVIVITVLLNIIFGIIIDTFSELRTDRAKKKQLMENTCFICSVDRFTLDTRGGGFERHIKEDHNMWAYLYLVVYLRTKEETEYNGWEQYVADMIARGDTSFMPQNNAIVLKEFKDREDAERRLVAEQISQLSQDVKIISRRGGGGGGGTDRGEQVEQHLMDIKAALGSVAKLLVSQQSELANVGSLTGRLAALGSSAPSEAGSTQQSARTSFSGLKQLFSDKPASSPQKEKGVAPEEPKAGSSTRSSPPATRQPPQLAAARMAASSAAVGEAGSWDAIRKVGTIWKRGQVNKAFKRRYFVLESGELAYFQDEASYRAHKPPRGSVPLRGVPSSQHTFHLHTLLFSPPVGRRARAWRGRLCPLRRAQDDGERPFLLPRRGAVRRDPGARVRGGGRGRLPGLGRGDPRCRPASPR